MTIQDVARWLAWLMWATFAAIALATGGGFAVAVGALLLWDGYRMGTEGIEELRLSVDRLRRGLNERPSPDKDDRP